MFGHKHDWKIVINHALARYDKQEGQDSTIYVSGRVEKCECGSWRIIPDVPSLQVVEVDAA